MNWVPSKKDYVGFDLELSIIKSMSQLIREILSFLHREMKA